VAVDQDVHALAFARQFAPKVQCVRCTLESLGDIGDFQAAIIADVLGHLARIEPPLLRLRRRLGPDATLLVAEPAAAANQSLEVPVRRAFTRTMLEGALRRAGFALERWLEGGSFLVAVARPAAELGPERLGRGLAALQRADYDAALSQVQPIIHDAASPLRIDAMLLEARVMVALGRDDVASEKLQAACEAAPSDPRPWAALSYLALRQGQATVAEYEARQAVKRDPLDASTVRVLATALDACHKDSQAFWRLSHELSPDDPLAAERVAALHAASGDEVSAQRVKTRFAAYVG